MLQYTALHYVAELGGWISGSVVQCSAMQQMDQWRAKQRTTAFNSIVPLFTPYLQYIYKDHYDDDDDFEFEGDAEGDADINL